MITKYKRFELLKIKESLPAAVIAILCILFFQLTNVSAQQNKFLVISGDEQLRKIKSDLQGNRNLACTYAIVESAKCFNPVFPETTVTDTAMALTFDFFACNCCPPNDAGIWSVTDGPGTVVFSDPLEDTTSFTVDMPGSYLLRYSWPGPWFSYVETEYNYYHPFDITLQAGDSCDLSTLVHFEYSGGFADLSDTLVWTLNGEPYTGPALVPSGDTVDFLLSVPSCGEYTLVATILSSGCGPQQASVTIHLYGDTPPAILGVGVDTTVICPDLPVFSEPYVDDPCDPDAELSFTTDSIPGDCEHSYTLVRIWTAINECGLMAADTQTIIHLPNPNPEILSIITTTVTGDTITALCDEEVSIPFPEIETTCGPAEVFYSRSDEGAWEDPFLPGTTTEVCYWGISPCGFSTDTMCFVVIVEECEIDHEGYCTLTQGFYGNPGGTFCNGMGTAELIESLLAMGNLVVGSGGNTMTFTAGNSGCIIDLLPGGGPAKKISGANTCASHPGIQIKNGRINNILLAQTITLGLNLRLDGDLGSLEILSDTLLTAESSGCGEEGDTATSSYTKYAIPASVYNVLSQNGTIVPTVQDLFALANTALGGSAIGATTLADISNAADAINRGFDECRIGYFQAPLQSQLISGQGLQPGSEVSMKVFPNPFTLTTNIEFSVPETGHVSVDIYNLVGQKVESLYNGPAQGGEKYKIEFSGDPAMNQVTYIAVIRTDHEVRYQRLVMTR